MFLGFDCRFVFNFNIESLVSCLVFSILFFEFLFLFLFLFFPFYAFVKCFVFRSCLVYAQ